MKKLRSPLWSGLTRRHPPFFPGATGASTSIARSNTYRSFGQWYFEATVNAATDITKVAIGIDDNRESLDGVAGSLGAISWYGDGRVTINGTSSAYGYVAASYVVGNVLSVCVDLYKKLIWFRVGSGNWNNLASANPLTGVNGFSISHLNVPVRVTLATTTLSDQITVQLKGIFAQSVPTTYTGWGAGGNIAESLSTTSSSSSTNIKNVGKLAATNEASSSTITKAIAKAALAINEATTATSNNSITKAPFATTEGSSASLTKNVGKLFATTEGSTATIIRNVGKLLTTTESTSASITKAIVKAALTVSSASNASIAKNIVKIPFATTEGSTASLTKNISKILATTEGSSALLLKTLAKLLAVSEASSTKLNLNTSKFLLYSEATSAAQIIFNLNKLLGMTSATSSPSLTKNVGKAAFATTEGSSASLTRNVGKLLATTESSTASITKNTGKLLAGTSSSTAKLTRNVGKLLAVTEASTSLVLMTTAHVMSLTVSAGTFANILKNVGKTYTGTASSAGSITKGVGKMLALNASTAPNEITFLKPATTMLLLTFAPSIASCILKFVQFSLLDCDDVIDVRRFCGYPVAGGCEPQTTEGFRYFKIYKAFEIRMKMLKNEEQSIIIKDYLPQLRAIEISIPGSAVNLDTDHAAVWYHNKYEVKERHALFNQWRKRLCRFLGIAIGPGVEDFPYIKPQKRSV